MADFGENPDQGKFWNEASGLSWVENDSLMSERLETISQLLLENLDLHPSSKILDIGCGGGTTALALAKRAPAKRADYRLGYFKTAFRFSRAEMRGS